MRNVATLLAILFALAAAAAVGSAVDGYIRAQANLEVKPRSGLCLLGTPCSEQVPTPGRTCLVSNQRCPLDGEVLPVSALDRRSYPANRPK
jgi:hypothetical protein